MYVPIMKNREQEKEVAKKMHMYFSENVVPLFEIIQYEKRYKKDPKTGEFIYEKKATNKRRTKVKEIIKDTNTILDIINQTINQNKAFIDFFRFDDNEYKNANKKTLELSIEFRNNDYYKKCLMDVGNFKNLIPVISIKKGFDPELNELHSLLGDLQLRNTSIAIRFTDEYLEKYSDFFQKNLSENDFLMMDIREQNPDSKFIELEEFQELNTKSKKILLNSPRLKSNKNNDYENLQFTTKINNSASQIYKDYGLDGFGDFGGLKDDLPSIARGTGSALALLYSKEKNAFFSVVNDDKSLGQKGYKYVVEELLKRAHILDPSNDCPAFSRIKEMSSRGKYGRWRDWNNITLTRYIHQQVTK